VGGNPPGPATSQVKSQNPDLRIVLGVVRYSTRILQAIARSLGTVNPDLRFEISDQLDSKSSKDNCASSVCKCRGLDVRGTSNASRTASRWKRIIRGVKRTEGMRRLLARRRTVDSLTCRISASCRAVRNSSRSDMAIWRTQQFGVRLELCTHPGAKPITILLRFCFFLTPAAWQAPEKQVSHRETRRQRRIEFGTTSAGASASAPRERPPRHRFRRPSKLIAHRLPLP
jgi:hypothetical protein